MKRRRRRDRVHPVERVRDVDHALLLADRREGVGERHAAWDLLAEEEADHLAVPIGLHLLAGDHDQARRRVPARPSRARPQKTLWSVTAIAPSPSSSACARSSAGSIEQSCEWLVCMWRSATIHSRSASGSVSGRLRPGPAALRVGVEAFEPLSDVRRNPGRRPRRPSSGRLPSRAPLRPPANRRSAAAASSGCDATSGGVDERASAAAASSRRRRRPSGDGTTIAARRRSSARASPRDSRPDVDAVAEAERDRGTGGEPGSSEQDRLPARQAAKRAQRCADDGQAAGRRLDHDAARLSAPGAKLLQVDTGGPTVAYAPGKRIGGA